MALPRVTSSRPWATADRTLGSRWTKNGRQTLPVLAASTIRSMTAYPAVSLVRKVGGLTEEDRRRKTGTVRLFSVYWQILRRILQGGRGAGSKALSHRPHPLCSRKVRTQPRGGVYRRSSSYLESPRPRHKIMSARFASLYTLCGVRQDIYV